MTVSKTNLNNRLNRLSQQLALLSEQIKTAESKSTKIEQQLALAIGRLALKHRLELLGEERLNELFLKLSKSAE